MTAVRTETAAGLFGKLLGEDRVRVVAEQDPHVYPEPTPIVEVEPWSRDELVEAVRTAHREKIGLVPVGGNGCPRLAPAGTPQACLLSLRRLDEVIEHAVGDLTFTAGAGLVVARAQEIVGAHEQALPISPPQVERTTLGGALACAAEGPTLATYGSIRDQVLGIEVVHGDGRLTRAGGRVVKNVSGYDLCRLYVGARGGLGIFTELTLRLRAREPSGCRLVWRHDDPRAAWDAALELRRAQPGLFALHVLAGGALNDIPGEGGAALVATLRGAEDLVESLGESCFADEHGEGERHVLPSDGATAIREPFEPGTIQLTIGALPADGARALTAVEGLLGAGASLVMDVQGAVLRLSLSAGSPWEDTQEAALAMALKPIGARVDIPSDPLFHLRRHTRFPWTRPGGPLLLEGLRTALDPAGILNPGRLEPAP